MLGKFTVLFSNIAGRKVFMASPGARNSSDELRSFGSAHSSVLGKDAAMGQDDHAFMASAETSRNSFSVAPLAD
jgi:hypothetical protein